MRCRHHHHRGPGLHGNPLPDLNFRVGIEHAVAMSHDEEGK
jgi:hypothetical protein